MSSELITLEDRGWRLVGQRDSRHGVLPPCAGYNAVLILPGGLALDDRETIIQSMSGQP